MKTKNSGFTASGFARPEIRPGDIFRDKYGSTVMIKGVSERRITTEDCARMVAVTVASRQRKIAAALSLYRANTA
ncbi:DUF4222 domain-containing protein [Escherichia coli]|nr:DUF4222 domain-containing protein [Escherichia coli]